MNKLPEGWTDDMTIAVPTGCSLDDIVDYVLQATIRRETPTSMVRHLTTEFGLTQGDAEVALDRTCGGVVRAATGRHENCPPREKGPNGVAEFSTVPETTRTDWGDLSSVR